MTDCHFASNCALNYPRHPALWCAACLLREYLTLNTRLDEFEVIAVSLAQRLAALEAIARGVS